MNLFEDTKKEPYKFIAFKDLKTNYLYYKYNSGYIYKTTVGRIKAKLIIQGNDYIIVYSNNTTSMKTLKKKMKEENCEGIRTCLRYML